MEGKITVRRNPVRTTKLNRFVDKDIFPTKPSTAQKSIPLLVPTSNTDPISVSTSKRALSGAEIGPKKPKNCKPYALTTKNVQTTGSTSQIVVPTASQMVQQSGAGLPSTVATNPRSRKSNKFIRFRFQIDCAAALDLDVDELVTFLQSEMKVEGQKKNVSEVAIERRNSNVHMLAKVMIKKKYLKLLAKKYLHKKKMFNYRVATKNKRAYKVDKRLGLQHQNRSTVTGVECEPIFEAIVLQQIYVRLGYFIAKQLARILVYRHPIVTGG